VEGDFIEGDSLLESKHTARYFFIIFPVSVS
jgi:hypothetical protein